MCQDQGAWYLQLTLKWLKRKSKWKLINGESGWRGFRSALCYSHNFQIRNHFNVTGEQDAEKCKYCRRLFKHKLTIILRLPSPAQRKPTKVLKANYSIQQTLHSERPTEQPTGVLPCVSALLLSSTGTPCLCVGSNAGQEDGKGLPDTEDSRHRTCTRIPAVNFGTLPGRIHTLLHFLGAGKEEKKEKRNSWYHLGYFLPPNINV